MCIDKVIKHPKKLSQLLLGFSAKKWIRLRRYIKDK